MDMPEYKSRFTGAQVDDAISKAFTAVQPSALSGLVYRLILQEGEEPSQEQLAEVYNLRPKVLEIVTGNSSLDIHLTDIEEDRLYYTGFSEEKVLYIKIEYSKTDSLYILEPYEYRLSDVEANPYLEGGEPTITSIGINGDRYVIPSGSSSPYVLQDYQLDLDEMEFECSDADAEYIFTNNPIAISLEGTIAIARDFTDDESKNDYSRAYTFFEFPDDDQIIIYEIGLYRENGEYSFDLKPTDPIGGNSGTILNDDVKNAILTCFQNVQWANDEDGQNSYNALQNLFFQD